MKTQATTVAYNGRAFMITGDSGVGKSALALALIERGAVLIADDITEIANGIAYAPTRYKGWLEVRGIGLVSGFPVCDQAPIVAEIRITEDKPERLPQSQPTNVPVFYLWAHDKNQTDKVVLIDKLLEEKLTLEWEKEKK